MSQKITLNIVGMTCVNCSNAIERASRKIGGVQSASVNFASGEGEFIIAEPALENILKEKIKKLGYDVVQNYEELEAKKAQNLRSMLIKFVLALVLAVLIMCVEMNHAVAFVPKAILCTMMSVVSLFYCGKNFFYHAYGALKERNFDMNVLVAMGSSLAFAYSVFSALYVAFRGAGSEFSNLYFSSASMIIAFIMLGKYLEERSKAKANDYIKKLINLTPKMALLVGNDGTITNVNANKLKPNDKVLVKNGAQIPCDGTIVEGGGEIDTSLITGESLGVWRTVGDAVSAGCVNVNGLFYVRASGFAHQSTLEQIKRLLSEAANKKMPIARFADRVANVFVPAIIAVALVTFIIWAVCVQVWQGAMAAICVLIISCPCALGLATPIAIVCAISNAARSGILIKNPEILEILKDVKTVIFDKTGTLSKGEISLNFTNLSEDDLREIASAQSLSEHPISRAFVKFAKEKFGEVAKFDGEFENIGGKGVRAKNTTSEILCGSEQFLLECDVKFEPGAQAMKFLQDGFGVIYCAINRAYVGFVAISDEIRDEAREVIAVLNGAGIKTIMLSGDNAKTANFVARNLTISQVFAQMLPNEKYEFIKSLEDSGERVLFVGDGTNDAPSLKIASAGIAMSAGSDIAKSAGDGVFVRDDLRCVPSLLALSRGAMRTIKQNLFWALFYNAVCIPLAAGALYPAFGVLLKPMYGAMAMCFSSVTVVLNSIRLKFTKF